LKFTGMQMAS